MLPATQDFATFVKAKSPLAATLLMFSVALPVLVSVTVFAPLFWPNTTFPNVSEVGTSETTGPLLLTVRLTVVVAVKLPDVPVMVTVDVPSAAVELAVNVRVLVVVVGLAEKPAVTPLGKPEAANVTLPVKPLTGLTVIVLVPLLP